MEIITIEKSWSKIKYLLRDYFDNSDFYDNYFKNIKIFKVKNNQIFFLCQNYLTKKTIDENFKKTIEKKFFELINLKVECIFLLQNELFEENFQTNKKYDLNTNLDSNLTFKNYVFGDFNKEIFDIKDKLLLDFHEFSPIFIYGSTGLGKTHAVMALGNEYKEANKNKKVLYLNTEDFLSEVYKSFTIGGSEIEKLKNQYSNIDMLIVDDIQFLSNKNKLNEVFFTIFNKLIKRNKIIILTSDKLPNDLKIDNRMISRFKSGLVINIKKPDNNSIIKIIDLFEKKYSIKFSNESLTFFANRFSDDIRILIGIMKKFILYINKEKEQNIIDIDKVKIILENEINNGLLNNNLIVNPNIIIEIICNLYNINKNDVTSKSRKKDVKDARNLCIYIIRKTLKYSYNDIGKLFSNRNHSTIIDSYKLLESKIKNNQEYSDFVNNIMKKI
ncbi:MAG: DnaA ATPase domain-containing protein [Mycoplasmoidaceae bacterium]